MLYLSANSENIIYTEVSANKTLSNPTYLMTMTHAQTGKRWSFIPQNISSISGSPYNSRYDIFKFNISATTENLTGGTNAWYYQQVPSEIYDDARYSGTNRSYIQHRGIVPNVVTVFDVLFDLSDSGEQVTGGTGNFYGNTLSPTIFQDVSAHGNVWRVRFNPKDYYTDSGEVSITATTNSGNTYTKTIYSVSTELIDTLQPWTYYGDSSIDSTRNYTVTYLETPVINIDEIGEFTYSIREQVNPVNLTPSLAMNQLEVGLAYITEGFTDTFYDDSETTGVYNPD